MRIEVTQEDIKKGVPHSCYKCPVARAARREFQDSEVRVDGQSLWVPGNVFFLPGTAMKFINKFDAGEKVKPFSFEVT